MEMIRKILIFGFLFLFAFTTANATDNQPPSQTFKVGEDFSYDVRWWFIHAGDASLGVKGIFVIDGWPCYHFVGTAKSQILFFFKVKDRIESFSTADALLPILFIKRIHEGKYKKDISISFNWKNPKNPIATYKTKTETKTFPLNPDSRDPLGIFYYFRTLKLPEPGRKINICVYSGKKNYPLFVEIIRREKIKVPAGTFNTILVKLYPQPGFEGLFRHEGDIKIWITDDNARIPVKIKAKIPILGSINIVLKKMKRP